MLLVTLHVTNCSEYCKPTGFSAIFRDRIQRLYRCNVDSTNQWASFRPDYHTSFHSPTMSIEHGIVSQLYQPTTRTAANKNYRSPVVGKTPWSGIYNMPMSSLYCARTSTSSTSEKHLKLIQQRLVHA
jgi:hypothetical protein